MCYNTIKKLIALWVVAQICAWSGVANASAYIGERAWFADATGQLSYPQLETGAYGFQPFSGTLSKGYTASTYWVRLRIEPSSENELVLSAWPSYLGYIELFDPLNLKNGSVVPQIRGHGYSAQALDDRSLSHDFLIKGGNEPRYIYLRLRTNTRLLLSVDALTRQEASRRAHWQGQIDSLFLGFLTTILLLTLLQWLIHRELLVAFFLVQQSIILALALDPVKHLSGWVAEPTLDIVVQALAVARVFVFSAAMLLLLYEFKPIKWLWRSTVSLLLLYLPIAYLLLLGNVRLALQINAMVVSIEAICGLLIAVSARGWQDSDAQVAPSLSRWSLIAFQVMIVVASLIPDFSPETSAKHPLLTPFFNSLLPTVLLTIRAVRLEKDRHQSLLDLLLAQNDAENERRRREEQERFLAMLTHELKTPLGVARMSLGASRLVGPQRDRIERALSNINAIVDRCRITDQFEHGRLTPQIAAHDFLTLVEECVAASSDPARVKVLERIQAPVQTDSMLVSICLTNLIDNALKYSLPGSSVILRIAPAPHAYRQRNGFILVACNGVGPAGVPDASRIFTKYYRSSGALSKSGSGLGLYLARSIARLLGGELSFRAENEQVEFKLWIPA